MARQQSNTLAPVEDPHLPFNTFFPPSSSPFCYPQQPPPHHLYYVQSPRGSSASTHDEEKFSERRTPYSSASSSPLSRFFYHPSLGEPLPISGANSKHPFRKFALPQPCAHPSSEVPKKLPSKWETVDENSVFPSEKDDKRKETRRLILFWFWVSLIAVVAMLLFALFISWILCRPHGPQLVLQGVQFLSLDSVSGSDRTAVPTEMLIVKSRCHLRLRNPSKYFRMIFHPTVVTLSYIGVPIAQGKVPDFHLEKGATKAVTVEVASSNDGTPLYGAAPSFDAAFAAAEEAGSHDYVTVELRTSMNTHVNIWWRMVRRHFVKSVVCDLHLHARTLVVLHTICTAHPPP